MPYNYPTVNKHTGTKMAKPANKTESKWAFELTEFKHIMRKPATRKFIKHKLSKARRLSTFQLNNLAFA